MIRRSGGGISNRTIGIYLVILAIVLQLQLGVALSTGQPLKQAARLSASHLQSRWRRGEIYPEDDDIEKEKQAERPTLTETETRGPTAAPGEPKIVVLGASGKIGRLVVQQLMEIPSLDATIVAFVRDYDKACRVFYEEVLVPRTQSRRGPKLQIVVGNLVPPEDLPGYVDKEEALWESKAESASRFYNNKKHDYDNRELLPDINESLEEAIKGCTTIISCVGAVRPTNLWSDYIKFPIWRLFQKDVSSWCRDERHPYYVHYVSTRKVLGFAESEQRRREAAIEEEDDSHKDHVMKDRIRFIRISDLCLSKRPWSFVPVVTNVVQSMVFRYQDMAERLLDESTEIDTINLRPGDLTDEERDVNTTSLQVDPSGKLPYPAMVSREDVASLAVTSALFSASTMTNSKEAHKVSPFHMTLAVRWVGECAEHQPSQGEKNDGAKDAEKCMEKILKGNRKSTKRSRRRRLKTMQAYHPALVRFMEKRRRNLKPYAIFVAFPVYLMLCLAFTTILQHLPLHRITGYERASEMVKKLHHALLTTILSTMPQIQQWFNSLSRQKSYISF